MSAIMAYFMRWSLMVIGPLDLFVRRKAAAQTVFGSDSRHHEILQILVPAGFCSCSRHLETAEGLTLNNRASNSAVDVEITANQLRFHVLDIDRTAGITAAGKRKFTLVGQC